jgi:hypothetical protein
VPTFETESPDAVSPEIPKVNVGLSPSGSEPFRVPVTFDIGLSTLFASSSWTVSAMAVVSVSPSMEGASFVGVMLIEKSLVAVVPEAGTALTRRVWVSGGLSPGVANLTCLAKV